MRLGLLSIVGFFSFTCVCSGSETFQKLEFSGKHSVIETKIRKAYRAEIEEALILSPENPILIEIALADLNSNGKEEVFVFLGGNSYFCGAHGCELLIFKDGLIDKKAVILNTSAKYVEISNQRTNGFKNIRLEEKTAWKWSGNSYK